MGNEQTLYERIGGEDAVKAAVIKLYEKILSDELLIPFFEGVDVAGLRRSQTAFITMALGGPHNYSGEGLRNAHRPMVRDQGLSDQHFNAVVGHLSNALKELGVAQELIEKTMSVVETTRDDVLCKGEVV